LRPEGGFILNISGLYIIQDVGDKTGKAAAAARCKEAGRITKEMLRNPMYRNNLRLWQAYAQVHTKMQTLQNVAE
jgi:hypothetical protein